MRAEIGPMAYAIVTTVRPKAMATPRIPMPRFGKAAEITALPHPPNTNHSVPMNSAAIRLLMLISFPE